MKPLFANVVCGCTIESEISAKITELKKQIIYWESTQQKLTKTTERKTANRTQTGKVKRSKRAKKGKEADSKTR